MTRPMRYATRQRGIAAVEFALILPILLMLLFGMIDAGRALQANIIMVNIGREGANMVARGNTPLETGSQDIIYLLMASAPPLDVNKRGMVYITRVMGVTSGGVSRSVVLDQYRWDDAARGLGYRFSKYEPASKVYGCTAWNAAACTSISSKTRPATTIMSGKLADGEVVHVVETFYDFDMLVADKFNVSAFGPDLYSMTIF
ncbi:pilus assembly protein [Pseudoduganella sp. SL102]|uniref:TadE/TadG family type IV pilus assembly protein n=1 Tax=Pseudoduganella sp. SL102 TaxID=2995154 RepID=UPI00248AF292|nr:TadE/TadG family type IV pilus assembly protein [Pseudoduganella sp. SL102]WBS04879.1 pilus assembly protein [Pseudoduganella sp. SL102]